MRMTAIGNQCLDGRIPASGLALMPMRAEHLEIDPTNDLGIALEDCNDVPAVWPAED